MRRFGRKLDVARLRGRAAAGRVLLRLPLPRRRRRSSTGRRTSASTRWPRRCRRALVVPRLVTADVGAAEDFYADALARGHEGVMVKALDAPYEAGRRGASWLKVKRAHTLDLVVLAAEWGHGRRHGWLSNLHLGARDPARRLGHARQDLQGHDRRAARLADARAARARDRRATRYTVYVRPELVVEIAFNDLQASPQYPGGLALRFARVKGYRDGQARRRAPTRSRPCARCTPRRRAASSAAS